MVREEEEEEERSSLRGSLLENPGVLDDGREENEEEEKEDAPDEEGPSVSLTRENGLLGREAEDDEDSWCRGGEGLSSLLFSPGGRGGGGDREDALRLLILLTLRLYITIKKKHQKEKASKRNCHSERVKEERHASTDTVMNDILSRDRK